VALGGSRPALPEGRPAPGPRKLPRLLDREPRVPRRWRSVLPRDPGRLRRARRFAPPRRDVAHRGRDARLEGRDRSERNFLYAKIRERLAARSDPVLHRGWGAALHVARRR
jgi:hypothetical protein